MNHTKKEYYKQRVEESTADLYETVTNYERMMIAKAIDISLFLSGLFIISWLLIVSHWLPNLLIGAAIVVYIGFYVLLRGLLHGSTVGYLIMNIRFVNVKTKKRVTLKEYFQYIRKSTRLEVRYSQIFKYYLLYDDRYVQNEPMKKYGMIVVDTKKYKRFYNDYQNNIAQLQKLQHA
ncbi:RDD family protein [Candidatus Xianfuyuplasma coldseepsis]|uniref:RDD family protein n=1 Tax=Candidatus Xianfuyuplasma coldseepsis TaxID=2782163 RepID=A0A7L7KQ24_9MOLU|nr:hypothetical protein [Xianfuyuplasma coldseepsis]QMS84539.1 RDD family protein [Xianfuyuplasma coldseepsis]